MISYLKIAPMAVAILLAGTTLSFADKQGEVSIQKSAAPAPAAPAQGADMKMMNTHCFTNTANCEGLAYWRNNTGYTVSCRVYWANGAGGITNFVLSNGATHALHVRTGDTNACVYGNSGVPDNVQRRYIYVE